MLKNIIKKYNIQIIISIIVLFTLTFVYTYSFFSNEVIGNDDANDIITTTGRLSLTYNGTSAAKMLNAMPGDSVTKTFTVENTGTLETTYDILWREMY